MGGLAATLTGTGVSGVDGGTPDPNLGRSEALRERESEYLLRCWEYIYECFRSAMHEARCSSEGGNWSFVVKSVETLFTPPEGVLPSEHKTIDMATPQDRVVSGWTIESGGVNENSPGIVNISLISPDGKHHIKRSMRTGEVFALIPPHAELLSQLQVRGGINTSKSMITFYSFLPPAFPPRQRTAPTLPYGPYSNGA